MAEAKILTVKDLAEKVGITPVELRKLLRKEFNQAGKTKVEGNRMEYRFDPNDPIVKQIMEKVKPKNLKPKQNKGQEIANKGGK
jgi:DNA replication protein DnaD